MEIAGIGARSPLIFLFSSRFLVADMIAGGAKE